MRRLYFCLLIFIAFFLECGVMAEEVTVTTYYPSPQGDYKEMQTSDNTYLATQSGNVGVGTKTPVQKLDVAGHTQSQSVIFKPLSSPPVNPSEGMVYFDGSHYFAWVNGAWRKLSCCPAFDPSPPSLGSSSLGSSTVLSGDSLYNRWTVLGTASNPLRLSSPVNVKGIYSIKSTARFTITDSSGKNELFLRLMHKNDVIATMGPYASFASGSGTTVYRDGAAVLVQLDRDPSAVDIRLEVSLVGSTRTLSASFSSASLTGSLVVSLE
jgi:hypothetical protein